MGDFSASSKYHSTWESENYAHDISFLKSISYNFNFPILNGGLNGFTPAIRPVETAAKVHFFLFVTYNNKHYLVVYVDTR